MLSALLRGQTPEDAHAQAMACLTDCHPELHALPEGLHREGLPFLRLDDPDTVGYTFKTLGAGMWALLQAPSFTDGLLEVIHAGGDADTNAAVASAVLGARFGRGAIPGRWQEGLVDLGRFNDRVDGFLAAVQEDKGRAPSMETGNLGQAENRHF